VVDWDGEVKPLGNFQARVYIVDTDNETLEKMSDELDQGEYEWLFSYPGFGPFAAPQEDSDSTAKSNTYGIKE